MEAYRSSLHCDFAQNWLIATSAAQLVKLSRVGPCPTCARSWANIHHDSQLPAPAQSRPSVPRRQQRHSQPGRLTMARSFQQPTFASQHHWHSLRHGAQLGSWANGVRKSGLGCGLKSAEAKLQSRQRGPAPCGPMASQSNSRRGAPSNILVHAARRRSQQPFPGTPLGASGNRDMGP